MSRARAKRSAGGAATSIDVLLRTVRPRRSRCQERGEEARIECARCRDEIPHHEAHRLTDRGASSQARRDVLERGRMIEECRDHATDEILCREARRHRAVVTPQGATLAAE